MILVAALLLAALVQLGFQSVHLWGLLPAAQPVLLVIVAGARRLSPISVAWLGLGVGLVSDVLADRVIGPGGIAGAVAGLAVALTVRRFELEGPLFWIGGSLLVTAASEAVLMAVLVSLGVTTDHAVIGLLATVAMTGFLGLLVAAIESAMRAWRSPARRRRRQLKRL